MHLWCRLQGCGWKVNVILQCFQVLFFFPDAGIVRRYNSGGSSLLVLDAGLVYKSKSSEIPYCKLEKTSLSYKRGKKDG